MLITNKIINTILRCETLFNSTVSHSRKHTWAHTTVDKTVTNECLANSVTKLLVLKQTHKIIR